MTTIKIILLVALMACWVLIGFATYIPVAPIWVAIAPFPLCFAIGALMRSLGQPRM